MPVAAYQPCKVAPETPSPILDGLSTVKYRRNLTKLCAAHTTAQLSFQEPDYTRFAPSQSYAPRQEYCPPEGTVTGDTVCRMSYKPVPLAPKEDYPWATKKKYAPPDTTMEGQTVYNQRLAKF